MMIYTKIKKNEDLSGSELDGLKILLVEDDEINIAIACKILSRWNIEIDVARNGLIALEKVRDGYFNMILMDVHMPVMDGLTATKEIRKFNFETPIIVLTSDTSSQTRDYLMETGISGIVYKPYNPIYLFQVLRKHAVAELVGAYL
jgi:CheY-like chemotaxis protein